MAEHNLPHFRIDKENPESGIKELVKIIKPIWNPDCIKFDPLSGGFSSKIFKVYTEDDPEDAVTVRIKDLAEQFEEHMTNDLEIIMIQKISKLGHFPTVHAVFENGYCYAFIKGKPMMNVRTRTGVITEEMMNAVAKELAFIHSVDVSEYVGNAAMCWKSIKKRILYKDSDFKHPLKTTEEQCYAEIAFIDDHMEKLKTNFPPCIYHGDCHFGNIVWNEDTKRAVIVDWEGVHIGHQYQDLSYFLITPSLFQPTGERKPDTFTYPKNYDKKFLRIYYEEYCKNMKKNFSEKDLEELSSRVHKAPLGYMLQFLIAPVSWPEFCSTFVENIHEFFERTLKEYLQRKKEVCGYDTLEIENSKTETKATT